MRLHRQWASVVLAFFITGIGWPGGRGANSHGIEVQPADSLKEVLSERVFEKSPNDTLKPVAEAKMSGVVVDGKTAKKKRIYTLLLAAAVVGIATLVLVSSDGNNRGQGRQAGSAKRSNGPSEEKQ